MEADGAQASNRRRRSNYHDLGSPEPKPQKHSHRDNRVERSTLSPRTTGGFLPDEGYDDPPRLRSSTVRLGPSSTGSLPQVPQTTSISSVPNRQQASTRQLAPRPRTTRKIAAVPVTAKGKVAKKGFGIRFKDVHWLVWMGLGIMGALVLWLAGSTLLAWGTQRYYDIRYGNPRTYQTDVAIGHGGDSSAHPSHFVAMNLNNQAIVMELKAGDPAKVATYKAPIKIIDSGQSPVTLDFKDVNGDHKLDMIIDIHLPGGQDQFSIFINDNDNLDRKSVV